jgi:carbamoyltransferase
MTRHDHFDELFNDPRGTRRRVTYAEEEMDLALRPGGHRKVMMRMARYFYRETGLDSLCLAGGVALNCVGTGGPLRDRGVSKLRLWIQAATKETFGAAHGRGTIDLA